MAWCSLANQIVKSNPLLLHLSSTFAITVWTKLNRLTPFVLWTLNLCLATQNTHGIYKRPSACKIQTDPLHLSMSSISYQLFIKVGRLHLLKRNKICKFFIAKVVGRFVLGKDPATKSDEFLEKVQTAFDPPPPYFWKNYVVIFYNGYGRIYARRHRPDSIS